ncbi:MULTISPECIES: endonuclease/exonuclease/phosphatase family protein [Rodentibacter]|uniref:endonuclease/exonuclease/phosphatase family protein n=1 Tax=Rodentibacter TaxID=1960084 RepID=UPI001CFE4DFC|nr:endonuclease/exonuclease/phosphatase family protein [Rodentibacter sp. JRC1]GJI55155.1 EEP domain-containing protein [Rodentibacter sp. JRC1]
MKKINKIFAFLLLVGIAVGIYRVSEVHIFESLQIMLESTPQKHFNQINISCFTNAEQNQPLEKTHIRLLSWNIHKGADRGWQQDLASFAQNQDFVLLQEATPQQNLPSFSTALFVSSFAYQGIPYGVKTFSKAIPKRYCGISQPEPWIHIPKVANAARYSLKNGGELWVVNVHLINFEWQPEAYRSQLKKIFSLLDNPKSAVILAGDFNAWNKERKAILNEFIQEFGLNEVSFSQDERVRFLGNPLDYIFVRGMKILSSKTERVTSSDHSPIWGEFEVDIQKE